MAAACMGRFIRNIFTKYYVASRVFYPKSTLARAALYSSLSGLAVSAIYTINVWHGKDNQPFAFHVYAKSKDGKKNTLLQTAREIRFLSFASLEYEGHVYMTPQDFLESVTEDTPRPRTGRSHLKRSEFERILKMTPSRRKGSTHLFREMNENGLISYTEYLFLICVLTKPRSGFRIAFNMFDTDGNQRVDKSEFLVLLELFHDAFDRTQLDRTEAVRYPRQPNIWKLVDSTRLEKIIATSQHVAGQENRSVSALHEDEEEDYGHTTETPTTLMLHFFGNRGNDTLKYQDFHRFMENLQTEVLELEFSEFARGMPDITEEEFGKILLRYTILSHEDREQYLQRLRDRCQDVKGIDFQNFKEFCQFLNSLDDFALAMKLYSFTNKPISEDEFKRAVKACTGQRLNDHLVHVVFQLFDIDGDGNLSQKEFLSVMKDRLHRGFRSQVFHQSSWDLYKSCVKNEMKKA